MFSERMSVVGARGIGAQPLEAGQDKLEALLFKASWRTLFAFCLLCKHYIIRKFGKGAGPFNMACCIKGIRDGGGADMNN